MKKHFYFYCVIILSGIILTQCQDDFEAVTNASEQEVSLVNAKANDVDDGITYLNQQFYLKSTDGTIAGMTRSSSEGLLTRNFFINQASEGENYLGVHILPASTGKSLLNAILERV